MVETISGMLFDDWTLVEDDQDLQCVSREAWKVDRKLTSKALANALSRIARNIRTDLL